MKFKSFVAAAAVALSAITGQAHAEQTWTVTVTGHIYSGTDGFGFFSDVGTNLAGLSFTQSITAGIDPSQWTVWNSQPTLDQLNGMGPGFTDTVTIDGHTQTFTSSWSSGFQIVRNLLSQGVAGGTDNIVSYNQGSLNGDDNTGLLAIINVASRQVAFVPAPVFNQQIPATNVTGNTSLQIANNDQSMNISANIETIAVSSVPEPASYGMLMAGLVLVGFAARRRQG